MRHALIFTSLFALAACASGGSHSAKTASLVPKQQLSPEAILAAAGPVAAGFRLEGGSLLHVATGFRCPGAFGDVKLVNLSAGAPGLPATGGATCTYANAGGLKGFLTFRENLPAGTIIEEADCRDLPRRLGLDMGPPLPGISRFAAPAPSALGAISVSGRPTPVQTCSWLREPFALSIVISVVSAVQVGGWSIQAAHTPPPPPCCAGYTTPMRPTFWLWEHQLLGAAASS